uniref:Splicing factor 45 n=1 Tax=Culicoides sonorensis TaxID=179676 RepID=A0A336LKC3_CULSO
MSLYDDDDIKTATAWSTGLKLVPQMKRNLTMQNKKILTPNFIQKSVKTDDQSNKNLKNKIVSSKPIIPVPALPAIAHYSWDIEDEYDPKCPNDYDKILKDRREKLSEEKKRSDKKKRNSSPLKMLNHSDDEEDYSKYAKLGKAMIAPPKSLLQSSVTLDNSGSVAEKIMAKYGWNSNKGLGKDEQGMASALTVEKTSKRGGRIIHESDFKEQQIMPPPPSTAIPGCVTPINLVEQKEQTITEIIKSPSKVVLLRNMVGPGDVDEELEPEVKEECVTKYGEVVRVVIKEVEKVTPEEAVRIFVEFKRIESAIKAVVDLNGRFFGGRQVKAVKDHPGTWVGIEWDDVSRGKHDGTVDNIQYFKTNHPFSGSMTRIEKVKGFETLEQAILNRYYETNENVLDEYLIKETRTFMHAPLLEIVGMDKIRNKQSNLEELIEVSVAGTKVNKSGNLSQFQNITTLDVSSTLIWNWNIVFDIVLQLKNLQYLDLSNNRILIPSTSEVDKYSVLPNNVKKVNLRNNGISSWQHVVKIASLWPQIECLSLQDNEISSIEKFIQGQVFSKLEKLDLQGNKISDFESVLYLGQLQNLKELLLGGNTFTEVKFPDCHYKEKIEIFTKLQKLNLRGNFIQDDSACFNELDKLYSLEDLSYSSCSAESYEDIAYKAIAFIQGLKTFNKRRIENADRRNAEIDTWKILYLKWLKLNDDEIDVEKFLNKFRSYPNLLAKYGTPEIDVLERSPKKSTSYKIHLKHVLSGKSVERKLPSKMSIQALYGLISKLFKLFLEDENFTLTAIDPKCSKIRVALEPSSKTIDFYSIKDGYMILIE